MNLLGVIRCYADNDEKRSKIFHIIDGSELTFGELWDRSEQLAKYILRIDPNDHRPVVVFGKKKHEMVISFLACIRSGRAYVPVDEIVPDDRASKIVTAANACLVINTSEVRKFQTGSAPVVFNSDLKEIFNSKFSESLDESKFLKTEDNIYIMFTSGSTGSPKGVQITRANIEDFLKWILKDYSYSEKPLLFLNQAPFNFDVSAYEFYICLVTGGAFVSVSHDHIKESAKLVQVLDSHAKELDVWVSTPSFLRLCSTLVGFSGEKFSKLRQFVLIGEVLPVDLARTILRTFPNTMLSNMYGPTEATIITTSYEVTLDSLEKYPSIPVGKSKSGSSMLVQNGELVIVGPNVSPGYLNDPVKTEKVFFKHEGIPAYRTGDSGSINEEGLIFYHGRLDFQIKLNGYRIELGDIETHLNEMDIVHACAILAKKVDGIAQWIVAFIVLEDAAKNLNSVELKKVVNSFLKKKLPEYMLPKQLVVIDAIPMNANGKIDRKQLESQL